MTAWKDKGVGSRNQVFNTKNKELILEEGYVGPNGENLADEVEKVPSASEGSLSPTRWVQKHNCPMPPLGPIPFTNLILQSEYPGFKMDIGLNHVRVGQASEGEGFFARLDCSDGERNDKEDMHVSNKWGPKHLAQQLLESDVVGPSTGAGGQNEFSGIALTPGEIERCKMAVLSKKLYKHYT